MMDGQEIAVIAIVAAAGLYLARRTWHTWVGKKSGCNKGCACGDKAPAGAATLIPSDELRVRSAR
jgi:hypothetical protein